jgi:hypothetical protein
VTLNGGRTDEWGLGWQVSQGANGRLAYHGGAITGFLSQFLRFVDRGLSVIILMNLDHANRDGIAFGVANLCLSQTAQSLSGETETRAWSGASPSLGWTYRLRSRSAMAG